MKSGPREYRSHEIQTGLTPLHTPSPPLPPRFHRLPCGVCCTKPPIRRSNTAGPGRLATPTRLAGPPKAQHVDKAAWKRVLLKVVWPVVSVPVECRAASTPAASAVRPIRKAESYWAVGCPSLRRGCRKGRVVDAAVPGNRAPSYSEGRTPAGIGTVSLEPRMSGQIRHFHGLGLEGLGKGLRHTKLAAQSV